MTAARISSPGLGTYAVHLLVLLALALAWAPLAFLRMFLAPIAELLIAASDHLFDAMADRLSR